jgi:hypothetical protein
MKEPGINTAKLMAFRASRGVSSSEWLYGIIANILDDRDHAI